jgi:hypothetical protein
MNALKERMLRLKKEGKKFFIDIGKPEGAYNCMPKNRSCKINVYCMPRPKKVTANDRALASFAKITRKEGWSYNENDKKIEIFAGTLRAHTRVKIEIQK